MGALMVLGSAIVSSTPSGRKICSAHALATTLLAVLLSACTSLGASGPSTSAIAKIGSGKGPASSQVAAPIQVVELTDGIARSVAGAERKGLFSDILGEGFPVGTIIGPGDVVDIAVWEAPPAALFGTAGGEGRIGLASPSRATTLPEQMVDSQGRITVPFAGSIEAAGRTPQQIEREIVARLAQKAHLPQVVVRLVRNSAANATIVGDVSASMRVPLTAKGERLLDALASAGGTKQPVGKTVIQITRGNRIATLPLEHVIRDPRQNIILQPDDVVTALYQPFSFTSLGAVGNSAEIPFEATGITLAQALGRVGGLQDSRANPKGVFIFRWEDPAALQGFVPPSAPTRADGRIPVIYRVNLSDPTAFFVTQNFPVRNQDLLYVSNASGAELQKFVSILSQTAFSIIGITNAVSGN
jgi:polysaccharide export outer membrane protein